MKKKRNEQHVWDPKVIRALVHENIVGAPKRSLAESVEHMLPDYHSGVHWPLTHENLLDCTSYPCRMFNKANAYE